MSVLQCDRHGCDNIMCDRLSNEYGYICDSCFEELVNNGPETNIAEFMESSPKRRNREAAQARFEVEFPSRHNEY